jgi:hypothetical protein
MKRKAARRAEIGISLFPFLAVLICTMGALIVLLVLVVQQARVQADTISDQMAEQLREQQLVERRQQEQEEEDHLWKQQILQQQRRELTERLSDGRLQLGHLEDHIRRLELRWNQLQAEWTELQANGEYREEDREAASQCTAADADGIGSRTTAAGRRAPATCQTATLVLHHPLRRSARDPTPSDLYRMPRERESSSNRKGSCSVPRIWPVHSGQATHWTLRCGPSGNTGIAPMAHRNSASPTRC